MRLFDPNSVDPNRVGRCPGCGCEGFTEIWSGWSKAPVMVIDGEVEPLEEPRYDSGSTDIHQLECNSCGAELDVDDVTPGEDWEGCPRFEA